MPRPIASKNTQPRIIVEPVAQVMVKDQRLSILVNQDYRSGLTALEGFSHINVLWWANEIDGASRRNQIQIEKPYVAGPDLVGVFASRSETRPNPILMTTAAVLDIDLNQGLIELAWFDAHHGSPVLDIKPYLPCADRVENVHLPNWCQDWPGNLEASASFDWQAVFNF